MLDIAKNEFLAKLDEDIRTEERTDIRAVLEEVWQQASDQALVDHEKRSLQHNFGKAVMAAGGPEEVAKTIGVSEDTIKRWVVHPFDMRLSEIRRFQHATGLSMHFEVLEPIDTED